MEQMTTGDFPFQQSPDILLNRRLSFVQNVSMNHPPEKTATERERSEQQMKLHFIAARSIACLTLFRPPADEGHRP